MAWGKMQYGRATPDCEGCPLLETCRFSDGFGSKSAQILVVTDQPSVDPKYEGSIISTPALKLFAKMAAKEGFSRNDFYFYPFARGGYDKHTTKGKDRTAIRKHCRAHLLSIFRRMKPRVIIPLGAEASQQVFGRAVKITKVRGLPVHVQDYGRTVVLPMLNPTMTLMYPQHEPTMRADFSTLGKLFDYDCDISAVSAESTGEYEIVEDLQFLVDQRPEVVALDTENTSLDWFAPDARVLTIQLCVEEGRAYLLSWDHPDGKKSSRAKARLRKQLRQILCPDGVDVVGQNLKYDAVFLDKHVGVKFRVGGDTLMLATLLDENAKTKGLADLIKRYVPAMANYSDEFDAKVDKARMAEQPLDENFVRYGCGDADAVFRLNNVLLPKVKADHLLYANYQHVVLPGLNAFAEVEKRGMMVSEEEIDRFQKYMEERVAEQRKSLLSQIHKDVLKDHVEKGVAFTRPDFLRDVLFNHKKGLRLRPRVFTKSTQRLEPAHRIPSVSTKDHLPFFFAEHPFTVELAQHIKNQRLLTASIINFRKKYVHDGMVRPRYNMHVTVTGRTSCVHADTKIRTRTGYRKITDLKPGDEVYTHRHRWRRVITVWLKPVTPMIDVHLSNGCVLRCTRDHRVLSGLGEWERVGDVCKQKTHGGFASSEGSGSSVSGDIENRCRDLRRDEDFTANTPSNHDGRHVRRGVHPPEVREVFSIEAREEKSDARKEAWELHRGLRGRLRVQNKGNPGEEILRPSDCVCRESVGDSDRGFFLGSCCASHRQRPGKQHTGQFGGGHKHWTPSDSREVCENSIGVKIVKVDPCGSYPVYDLEVEEDHSYCAAGVFHHNSESPNGQNYVKHGPEARMYQRIFVAPKGYVILAADYSQAELRIAADMARDRTMIGIYNDDGDIHIETALIIMNETIANFKKLTKIEQGDFRFRAKAVNFGLIYGMLAPSLVVYAKTQYGVEFTLDEAEAIRDRYFEKYSGLQRWHRAMIEFAHENKYVRSYSGRVRHLPMIDSPEKFIRLEAERQSINAPVQNFGSDLGVMAAGRIEQEVDPRYMHLVGFVHDALYAYVKEEYVEWGAKTLRWYMQSNPIEEWFGRKMLVPILADVGFGRNMADIYEMGHFPLDPDGSIEVGTYDFEALLKDKYEEFALPEQTIPPNDGLREGVLGH